MAHASPLNYPQLMEELKTHCQNKDSGTLFITTGEMHAVRFELDSGKIVAVRYRAKKGSVALSLIKQVRDGRCSFSPDALYPHDSDLPETQALLDFLEQAGDEMPIKSKPNQSQPETTVDSSQMAKLAEQELARYLGPVAAIIVEDVLDKHKDTETALDALADEISSKQERRKFTTNLREKLGL